MGIARSFLKENSKQALAPVDLKTHNIIVVSLSFIQGFMSFIAQETATQLSRNCPKEVEERQFLWVFFFFLWLGNLHSQVYLLVKDDC